MSRWESQPLGSVCEVVSGSTPKSGVPDFWGGDILWVTPKELSGLDGISIGATERSLTSAGLASCGARVLPAGSVLLSSRAPIGHTAITVAPMATNQGFKSLVPDAGRLHARYLLRWLRGHRSQIEDLGSGATFKEVSKRVVERIEIPLPPLDEQRRIAAVLDRADALRTKRRTTLAGLDELMRSIFAELVGDEASSPWETARIGDLCATSSGGTPDRSVTENYGGEIPWVKSGELHDPLVLSTQETLTRQGLESSSAKVLPAGTVLVAMYGATAGVVAQLGISASTNQAICALNPGPALKATWLVHALRNSMRSLLATRAGGAQPNLSQDKVRNHVIPVPPLAVQEEFESAVRRIETTRDASQRHYIALESLFASLQQRAFRGDLFDSPLPAELTNVG